MEVTKLKRWDKGNNLIVGQCRTALGSGWDKTEFAYDSVYISSIGNNEWVMSGGSIADRISVPDHTLTPQAVPENREAFFSADSIYVDPTGLNLAGVISWNMVHLNSTAEHEQINTKRVRLSLASQGKFDAALTYLRQALVLAPDKPRDVAPVAVHHQRCQGSRHQKQGSAMRQRFARMIAA